MSNICHELRMKNTRFKFNEGFLQTLLGFERFEQREDLELLTLS
jgi:hypothetical protein